MSGQRGMTASPIDERHCQLDEEDESMRQIAPGGRADNRLIVPAAFPAASSAFNPVDLSSAVNPPAKDKPNKWYEEQPPGFPRTNEAYRKAHVLPTYSKNTYAWCVGWKQMGEECTSKSPKRP
ncbi:hypothetical protein E4U40_005173 [Claviceps sp. LM458 group G5]|nr:hypothetical protein E4U40_005173 [Claviceps sp. LM458 group G5]